MNITNKKWSILDGLFLTLRYSPIYGSLTVIYNIFAGFIPAIQVGVTAGFVDSAIGVASGEPISNIYIPLLFMMLLTAFDMVSDRVMGFFSILTSIRMQKNLRVLFLQKRARLEYKHIEDQESWDLITRTAGNAEGKITDLFNFIFSIIRFIVATVSVLWILIAQIWLSGVLIVVISVPLIFVSYKSGKRQYKAERDTTKIERKYKYLIEILTGRNNSLERTLFGYSAKMNEKFAEEYGTARDIKYKVRKKTYIRNATTGSITASVSMIAFLILIPSVYNRVITVGMFISLANALFNLINSMSWELSYHMESLAKNNEFIKDLNAFSALSEEIGGDLPPAKNVESFSSLEFRDVHFKYPKSEKHILKGMSFKIEKGKHYSFVGVNGAGKTTITKIMTGLFREYEGTVLLNGKDLKQYTVAELKAVFCGVFQDFARYNITIKENIAIGNVAGVSDEQISAAVELSELDRAVAKHEAGLDTYLGKINENGVDFSGGEWQRLAMARAIVNPAEILILDEPTAALDPLSESRLYQKFEEVSRDKTTLFISHRLGSTKLADVIFVLSDGKMIESGSHDELMAVGGIYAEMFKSQRSWYS